ncbi:hypothetical protein [Mycolicibacter icosiumassiliensis]|uniref:hypothetical protein n=1 Tax=Mycolicibacter icosiumassiliensis TaxID=1792835 RepID=UPI000830466E|nr:hypothetical protein [Mycolicibacter icosiumassiliensis]
MVLVVKRWGTAGLATALVGSGVVVPALATDFSAFSAHTQPAPIALDVALTAADDWLTDLFDLRSPNNPLNLLIYNMWSHDGLFWGGLVDPFISSGTLGGEVLWALQGDTEALDNLLAGDFIIRGPSMWIPVPGDSTVVDPLGWLVQIMSAIGLGPLFGVNVVDDDGHGGDVVIGGAAAMLSGIDQLLDGVGWGALGDQIPVLDDLAASFEPGQFIDLG